jgi:hypothetical protein
MVGDRDLLSPSSFALHNTYFVLFVKIFYCTGALARLSGLSFLSILSYRLRFLNVKVAQEIPVRVKIVTMSISYYSRLLDFFIQLIPQALLVLC